MPNAAKRRDSKGRVLQTGETQRKNGLYVFSKMYRGKRIEKTSWRLTESDPVPYGKEACEALRTIEDRIRMEMGSGISIQDKTLSDVFDVSIDSPYGRASEDTKADYKNRFNRYVRPHSIGDTPIKTITTEDLEDFFQDLLDMGTGSAVLDRLNRILSRTMGYAIKKKLRTGNPCSDISIVYTPETVEALTEEETSRLLSFVQESDFCYWYDFIRFILNTGTRIGEATGFTWSEYDEPAGVLHIRQAINTHLAADGGKVIEMDKPKSQAGLRDIPANDVVKEILNRRKQEQKENGTYMKYKDLGVSGFVFLNQGGTFIKRDNFAAVMRRLREAYNRKEEAAAAKEEREPQLMPPIHPHVLRHTFCTRLCEREHQVKVIQMIMGHSDYSVTMNIYHTVQLKQKKDAIKKISL